MNIKDALVGWFIKNIIIPKQEIINIPGYITEEITEKGRLIKIRDFCLPENLFVNIENKLKNDSKVLYQIGKNFGYIYADLLDLPKYSEVKKSDFLKFAKYFTKYVEAIYASKINLQIKYEEKFYKIKMYDYIICRKNGLGYIMSEGGIAGIWSYACQDPTIEAVQPKCQGRGDKYCEVIAAPYDYLVQRGYKPIRCTKLETVELTEDYEEFNKIRPTTWATNSLEDLINAGFFEYKHGQVTYQGERFFLCEASFMYILERELKKVKNGLDVLWKCSFNFGKRLAEISGKQEPCKFITDFFPALGFGDVLAVTKRGKYEIYVNYFPWLPWWKEIDFVMFRGMLSGVISGFSGKKVELKKIEKDISAGYLSLFITH